MKIRNLKAALLLLMASCAAALCDTVVVPITQATAAGNTPIPLTGSAIRIQEVVGSANGQFSGPVTIVGLRARAAVGAGAVSSPGSTFKLTLSTTQAYSNTQGGHPLLSTTYANNVGPDATLVYNGPINLTSPGCAAPGPCPFDMSVAFTTPFSFDPTKGRLLIDYVLGASTGTVKGGLDAVAFADSTSATLALIGSDPSQAAAAGVLPGGIVFELDTVSATYYFPQLAFGGGWQTTLTYVDYSAQPVSCQTSFYSDLGTPLAVPFGTSASTRGDALPAGGTLHQQTTASASDATLSGWAYALCSAPIQASVLYRIYNNQNVPQGEAGVNASTSSGTKFVTFAETSTGVAYANPSPQVTATVTITALNAAGIALGSKTVTLGPKAHGAVNVGPFLGLNSFSGSVQITANVPIVSLSLNAEAFPVFSSLPPGDVPGSAVLAPGH